MKEKERKSPKLPKRTDMLHELSKYKDIDNRTIKELARIYKSTLSGSSRYDKLCSIDEKMLSDLYRAFIKKEHDASGRMLELRAVNYYLKNIYPKIDIECKEAFSHISLREKLVTSSGVSREQDVIVWYKFSESNTSVDIMECKDKKSPVNDDEMRNYLEIIRETDALRGKFSDVMDFYFVSASGFTERALNVAREKGGEKGIWVWKKKALGFLTNDITIHLIEEIGGTFKQVSCILSTNRIMPPVQSCS